MFVSIGLCVYVYYKGWAIVLKGRKVITVRRELEETGESKERCYGLGQAVMQSKEIEPPI